MTATEGSVLSGFEFRCDASVVRLPANGDVAALSVAGELVCDWVEEVRAE